MQEAQELVKFSQDGDEVVRSLGALQRKLIIVCT